MKRPKLCWGAAKAQHAEGCRPARPLCRWMRKVQAAKYGRCQCGTPPWPHRRGYCASGAGLTYMVRTTYGEPPAAPGLARTSTTSAEDELFGFFDALAASSETG